MYSDDRDAEMLSKEIAGATIKSVIHNRNSEGHFTLQLERDGKDFEVDIYGTDLGWWFESRKDK